MTSYYKYTPILKEAIIISSTDSLNNMLNEALNIRNQMNEIVENVLPPQFSVLNEVMENNRRIINSISLPQQLANTFAITEPIRNNLTMAQQITNNFRPPMINNHQFQHINNLNNEIKKFIYNMEQLNNTVLSDRINSLYKLYGHPGDILNERQQKNVSDFSENINENNDKLYQTLSSSLNFDIEVNDISFSDNNIKYKNLKSKISIIYQTIDSNKNNEIVWMVIMGLTDILIDLSDASSNLKAFMHAMTLLMNALISAHNKKN